jgi:hypothetical protein
MRLMHLVAKTYGRLPSDLLRLTWAEYQFCVAALMAGLDTDDGKGATGPVSYDWSDLV